MPPLADDAASFHQSCFFPVVWRQLVHIEVENSEIDSECEAHLVEHLEFLLGLETHGRIQFQSLTYRVNVYTCRRMYLVLQGFCSDVSGAFIRPIRSDKSEAGSLHNTAVVAHRVSCV